MKKFLLILLLLFSLCSLIIFSIDLYFYLVNRYCRFHIGRWENDNEWINAVEKVCVKWTKRTPTVKITDNSKLIAIDMINGKYRSKTIQPGDPLRVFLRPEISRPPKSQPPSQIIRNIVEKI